MASSSPRWWARSWPTWPPPLPPPTRSGSSTWPGSPHRPPTVADGFTLQRYEDLAASVIATQAVAGAVRLVAVDGPGGSGKTTFAARLAAALRPRDGTFAVIHTDDLLDGWADQVSFWPRLEEWVLAPLRRGAAARY